VEIDKIMTSSTDELTGVLQVAARFHYGFARLDDGSVWAWGSNLLGQLGTGLDVVAGDSCYAFKVALPKDANGVSLKAKDIHAFGSSSMTLTEDGAWYALGFNVYGQLGVGSDGYNSSVLAPVKMSGFKYCLLNDRALQPLYCLTVKQLLVYFDWLQNY